MKLPTKVDFIKFLDSDRAILMVCIFIALIFWLLVKLSQSFETTADFQIEYNIPSGKSFVASPPSSVTATLEGSGWDLISYYLQNQDTEIRYELNNIPDQTINPKTITDKIQMMLEASLKVININMDYFLVQMEQETEVKVPLTLVKNIQFAEQFQLADSIVLEPDSIIITGPATEIGNLTEWETTMLTLEDLKKDQLIELDLKAPQNKELRLSQDKAQVNIKVEQFTQKSVFVPITIKNAPDSLKIFPSTAKLNCVLGISKFNDVDKNSFQLEVDLKDIPLNTEQNILPVQLAKYPNYVRGINYQPKSVEFFFVKTESDSTSVAPIN